MKKNSKVAKILLVILGAIMILGGLMMLVPSASYIFKGETEDIYQMMVDDTFDEHIDDYVEVEIDAVLDVFAKTTHSVNFIPVGNDYHYIGWLQDDSIIAIKVKSSQQKEMERIIEETWDYVDGNAEYFTEDTLVLKGQIKKLSSDISKYYIEALDDIGVTDSDLLVRYLEIDTTESRLMNLLVTLGVCLIGAFMIYAGLAKEKVTTDTMITKDNTETTVSLQDENADVYSDNNKE